MHVCTYCALTHQASRDGYVLTGVNTMVNAYAVAGLRALAALANASGDAARAASLSAEAVRLAAAINALLWDDDKCLYRDGLDDLGEPIEHWAWHATVFAAAFGLVPQARWPAVLAYFRRRGMVGSVYSSFFYLTALYQVVR